MKLSMLAAAIAATVVFAQTAQAREHYYRHATPPLGVYHGTGRHWSLRRYPATAAHVTLASATEGRGGSVHLVGRRSSGPRRTGGGRPRAWCGWEMRQWSAATQGPNPSARNWARWGSPGPAGIGAVVVWAHHVGKIVGCEGGQCMQSGNDGNRLRTRPLSSAAPSLSAGAKAHLRCSSVELRTAARETGRPFSFVHPLTLKPRRHVCCPRSGTQVRIRGYGRD